MWRTVQPLLLLGRLVCMRAFRLRTRQIALLCLGALQRIYVTGLLGRSLLRGIGNTLSLLVFYVLVLILRLIWVCVRRMRLRMWLSQVLFMM